MYKNSKTIFFFLIAVCFLYSDQLNAQATARKRRPDIFRKKSLVMYIGGGVSKYVSSVDLQPVGTESHVSTVSPVGTLRLMWQPQYRLRVGIETGICNFYSYNVKNGNTRGDVSLRAIPLLIVWSMPVVRRLDIFAGFGSYLLTSKLNYAGHVTSKIQSLGSSLALAYRVPVSTTSAFAAEAKWMSAFQTKDNAVSLELRWIWKFYQWGGGSD